MRFFNLKNEVQRKIFINSVSLIIAILAYLVISKLNVIYSFIGTCISILAPFILGFGIAFLLNGPILWLEHRMAGFRLKDSSRRMIATVIMFLALILFLVFAIWVIIPSLLQSATVFLENIATYSERLENWVLGMADRFHLDEIQIKAVHEFFTNLNLTKAMTTVMQNSMSLLMGYSYDILHGLTNLIIAIAAGFYMMMDKEKLLHMIKTLSYSLFSKERANFLTMYSMDAKNVFQQYIVGNIIDSLIVGLVCWLGMVILQIPYAPMIGFIIGVTNIIPVFGPFLGAIPVGLLLLMIHPMYAFIFAIFILILQQVDGNVLKPIILGDKLGISGFWILFSVTVGGSLFGIAGMFLGVPVFALIYEGIQDLVDMRLNQKHLIIPEESGVIR